MIVQFVASPTAIAYSTTCLFNTGRDPGMPVHTGQVWLLGAPPKAVEQPQKIFVFVANSTWTSSPITVSYVLLIYLILPLSSCQRTVFVASGLLVSVCCADDFFLREAIADEL